MNPNQIQQPQLQPQFQSASQPSPAQPVYQQPVSTPTNQTSQSGRIILQSPLPILAVRAAQFVISLIVLALCAWIIHDVYIDELGYGIAVTVLTWVGLAYIVFTETIGGLRAFYHVFAILAIDAFFVIMWLAAMAAIAAKRAKFRVSVSVSNCYNDGSLVDSSHCSIFKRAVVLFSSGLAGMAAAAGLSALVMVLFIATLVRSILAYRGLRSNLTPTSATEFTEIKQQYPPQGDVQPTTTYVPTNQPPVQQQFDVPAPSVSPYPVASQSPPPQNYTISSNVSTVSPPPQSPPPPAQSPYPAQSQMPYPSAYEMPTQQYASPPSPQQLPTNEHRA